MKPLYIEQADLNQTNEILHYLKAQQFPSILAELTEEQESWCPFLHGGQIEIACYMLNPRIQSLLLWLSKYTTLCKFMDANRYAVDEMAELFTLLQHPEIIADYDTYKAKVERFDGLAAFVEKDINEKIARLTCQESIRLDEALVCFENYSFYASVIMAVSAVEGRIMEIIKRKNKALYNSTFSNATLGQLIQLFDEHQYTDKKYAGIKKQMPDKHKPLIALLNQYRIFSAHPVDETISAQVAESILHLAFCFMIDKTTCPYEKNELLCKKT